MASFSVVVPTFNRAGLLAETLDSILGQEHSEFELIVVDDGSTDQTMAYLQSLPKRVKVLTQSNRGAGAARNLGARHAEGKYLAFLDSDDVWFPWTLESYQNVIEKYRPSFIAGKPYCFSEKLHPHNMSRGAPEARWFRDYFASGDEWRWWGASSFVILRDVFEAVGGFTEEGRINDEDTDLTLRMGIAPGFVQITAPVTFGYREHGTNVSKDHKRLLVGTQSRIRAEREGRYPGGALRAVERRRILTRHVRPVVVRCIRQGLRQEAWDLYLSTFIWNASLGRVKYLAAFPLFAVTEEFRRIYRYAID